MPKLVSVSPEAWWDGKFPDVVDTINKIVLMTFGVFVIIRGRGRLALLGGLALYGLAAGAGIRPALIGVPPPVVIIVHLTRQVFLAGGLFCLALMAIEMLRAAIRDTYRKMPRIHANLLLVIAVVINVAVLCASVEYGVVYPLFHTLNVVQGPPPSSSGAPSWRHFVFPPEAIAILVPIGLMSVAVARASRSQTELYRWIFTSTALGLSGALIWLIWSAVAKAPAQVHNLVLTEIVMGVGYGYAFVRHRLVDIAFVLNRAVMLGVIAVIIAAIVVLIDFKIDPIIQSWLMPHQQLRDFWVGALQVLKYALILAVPLSLRFLEGPIEFQIDRLLFARRYRIKEGLSNLQAAAGAAESADGLVRLVTSRLRTLIDARSVALYEPQGNAFVPTWIDAVGHAVRLRPLREDDPTIAKIRNTLAPSDARPATDLVASAVAFPMAIADHFTGAVVIERQSVNEPYDPDLRALVARFVHEFAAALLFLRTTERSA